MMEFLEKYSGMRKWYHFMNSPATFMNRTKDLEAASLPYCIFGSPPSDDSQFIPKESTSPWVQSLPKLYTNCPHVSYRKLNREWNKSLEYYGAGADGKDGAAEAIEGPGPRGKTFE